MSSSNEWQRHAAALVERWRAEAAGLRQQISDGEVDTELGWHLNRARADQLDANAEEVANLGTTEPPDHDEHNADGPHGCPRCQLARDADRPARHKHTFQGQTLIHVHRGGAWPHGYFGHPEDRPPREPSEATGTWELA